MRIKSYMRALMPGILLLLTGNPIFAQQQIPATIMERPDSNTIETRRFFKSLESAFVSLNKAEGEAGLNRAMLPSIQEDTVYRSLLTALAQVVKSEEPVNYHDLQVYKKILNELTDKTAEFHRKIRTEEARLMEVKRSIDLVASDSILLRYYASANELQKRVIKPIRDKWLSIDSTISSGLDTINRHSVILTLYSITITDLKREIDASLKRTLTTAFAIDAVPLWPLNAQIADSATSVSDLPVSKELSTKILAYYFSVSSGRIVIMPFLLFTVCYIWRKRSWRKLKKHTGSFDLKANFGPIGKNQLLASLIAVLSMLPLFDLLAPINYWMFTNAILLFLILLMPGERSRERYLPFLILLFILHILFCLLGIAEINILSRDITVLLNLIAVIAGIYALIRYRPGADGPRFFKTACLVFTLFNLFALLLNLSGRVSMSNTLSNSGLLAISSCLILSVAVGVVKDMLMLQYLKMRFKYGIYESSDIPPNLWKALRAINSFAALIWFVIMLSATNIYFGVSGFADSLFLTQINLGGASISMGSIVYFMLTVWLAHNFQSFVGLFFGESGNEDNDEERINRSGLVIARLAVVCIGYLLAVAASGLPIEKITIVLGALGVGIGMGLQNIVNNFVSGVILLFDKPLRIGDMVAIGGSNGKVKEIGVRSSTLVSQDGAEIIIPNGNILSQSIVNWTFSNQMRRIDVDFVIQPSLDIPALSSVIKDTLMNSGLCSQNRSADVLILSIKDEEIKFRVTLWTTQGNQLDVITSEVRYKIFVSLRAHGVPVKG